MSKSVISPVIRNFKILNPFIKVALTQFGVSHEKQKALSVRPGQCIKKCHDTSPLTEKQKLPAHIFLDPQKNITCILCYDEQEQEFILRFLLPDTEITDVSINFFWDKQKNQPNIHFTALWQDEGIIFPLPCQSPTDTEATTKAFFEFVTQKATTLSEELIQLLNTIQGDDFSTCLSNKITPYNPS